MSPTQEEKKAFYESLCDLQIPDTIKFSPNAQRVLYSTKLTWGHKKGKHPVSTLWLAETGKVDSSRQLTSGKYNDYQPRWNPDGQSIAFISDREEAGKKWAIYQLNLRNGVAEGEAHAVTNTDNEQSIAAFEFSPDGKTIAYISPDEKSPAEKARDENGEDWQVWGEDWRYARLRFVNLATKEVTQAPKTEPEKHVTGLSWSPDGKCVAFMSTHSPHIEEPWLTGSKISIFDVGANSIDDVCSFPAQLYKITWAADGNIYFGGGAKEDKGLAGNSVYKVSSETKLSPRSLSPNYEKAGFGIENDVADITRAGGDIFASVLHGMETRISLLSSKRVVYAKPQDIDAYDVAYTTDSDEIVLAVATSDVNHPLEVFTVTASGGAQVRLSNHGAALKDLQFGTCTFLSHPSTDKEVQLDNVFLTPSSTTSPPAKHLPTIVLIHGGPTGRNCNAFNSYYYFWAPYLLRLGYGILMPNYRGGLGKGEHFASFSGRGIGKWDYEDVVSATQNAIETGYADKDRLIVGGLSQGGYLSFLSSVRNGSHGFGWKFKGAIPLAGVCDQDAMPLTSDLGASLEVEMNAGRAPWNVAKDDTRNRNASALWEFREAMERSKKEGEPVVPPMLILHGEKDERVPITQAWGFRRALASAGLPFEMVTYPRQGHIFTERKHWINMISRIEKFCEKHIGPGEK